MAFSSIPPGHVQLAILVRGQSVFGSAPYQPCSPLDSVKTLCEGLCTLSVTVGRGPPQAAAGEQAAWEVGSQAGQRTSVCSGLAYPAGARPQSPLHGTMMVQ